MKLSEHSRFFIFTSPYYTCVCHPFCLAQVTFKSPVRTFCKYAHNPHSLQPRTWGQRAASVRQEPVCCLQPRPSVREICALLLLQGQALLCRTALPSLPNLTLTLILLPEHLDFETDFVRVKACRRVVYWLGPLVILTLLTGTQGCKFAT